MKKILFLLSILATFQFAGAQSSLEQNLAPHINYLADDKLEGRATGSEGEKLAADYIAKQFLQIGLSPLAESGNYLQPFPVNAGKEEGQNNYLIINDNKIGSPSVYPIGFSANGLVEAEIISVGYGISAPELNFDDYLNKDVSGKIALIKLSGPEGNNPHSKFGDYMDLRTKVLFAVLKGAKGVIFYSASADDDIPLHQYRRNSPRESIPVVFANIDAADKLLSSSGKISLSTQLHDITKTGHNVFGFIDNGAINTIVIGAHYDHLGHGEIDGSLYRGEPAIHNGADDNASGVALIIELARKIKSSGLKNNNYIFLAFSGEEMGLFGSKAFVDSDIMKKYTINYMLNFDMVGRLDTSNILIINGTGTSPEWALLDQIHLNSVVIKKTEGGIGPSDQTSFYLKDIPAIHFFTGSHEDYHKPSDDVDKINYQGIETVLHIAYQVVEQLNNKGRIAFTKTNDSDNEAVPDFKVTLGVIPDYAYSGKGMRIDGVSDGKPAAKAGLLAGDIVVKLGDYDVSEMMSYMKALSKFNKGESTNVTIIRNGTELEIPIQF